MCYTRCRRNLAAAAAGASSRVTEHRYDVRKLAISGIDTLSLDPSYQWRGERYDGTSTRTGPLQSKKIELKDNAEK